MRKRNRLPMPPQARTRQGRFRFSFRVARRFIETPQPGRRSPTMTQSHPVYGRIDGPIVIIGFGSIGHGTLPLIERHFDYDADQLVVIEPDAGTHTFLSPARHPPSAGRADAATITARCWAGCFTGQGVLRQPQRRYLLARPDALLPRARRALHRHRGRALGRLLLRHRADNAARTNYALRQAVRDEKAAQSRRARPRSPAAAPIPAWCRGSSRRRC